MNPFRTKTMMQGAKKLKAVLGVAAITAASLLTASCEKPKFTEAKTFAGGVTADAQTLHHGWESYMLYCYACHGEKGDGKGPSSYGLRPPPRDFTKGIFKFARVASSDELPNDDDLARIIKGGLHGTAMLPWDIPDVELERIIQYIKTFAPQKWEKKKRSGEPVATLKPFVTTGDPWAGNEKEAIEAGRDLYHFRAECLNCHPSYGTKQELYYFSVAAAKKDPSKYKPLSGFRADMYGSVAKDSSEYAQRILPPDFTFHEVRSVRKGQGAVEDLFRLISFGVYPIMPKWTGALPDKDIWALAHYVKSLMDIKGTKDLIAYRTKIENQAPFEIPKPAPEKPAEEKKEGDPADGEKKEGEGEKKDGEAEKKDGEAEKKDDAEKKDGEPKKDGDAKKDAEPKKDGDAKKDAEPKKDEPKKDEKK
jgi:mono/diheme cytochrome c family protein